MKSPGSERAVENTVEAFFAHLERVAGDEGDTIVPHDLPNGECATWKETWTTNDKPVILEKRESKHKSTLVSQNFESLGSWMDARCYD